MLIYNLIWLVDTLVQIYIWVVIIHVVLSLLVNFNVVNPYSPAIRAIQKITFQLTEPLLAPIRRILPDLGGLDISPIILILGVQLAHSVFVRAMLGSLA